MEPFYVVDAGVLFSDWMNKIQRKCVTTSSIINEIRNRPSIQRAEAMISVGRLSIEEPSLTIKEDVQKVAETTGDASVLSVQDIELIALALQRMQNGTSVILVSSDLAILNTGKKLGIPILDPKDRMIHEVEWMLKCPACGHSTQDASMKECIVCGTEMRRSMKSRRRIQY